MNWTFLSFTEALSQLLSIKPALRTLRTMRAQEHYPFPFLGSVPHSSHMIPWGNSTSSHSEGQANHYFSIQHPCKAFFSSQTIGGCYLAF